MSDRRANGNVVRAFVDPELELVLAARNWLADPDKWIQGRFGKGRRKCWAGHLLKAGARDLDRIAVRLGFSGCPEMVEFNDGHTHAEVLARVDEGIAGWVRLPDSGPDDEDEVATADRLDHHGHLDRLDHLDGPGS